MDDEYIILSPEARAVLLELLRVPTPKEKWKAQYRLERIKRKEQYLEERPQGYGLGQSAMVRALRALYGEQHTPEQDVFISLFYRYRSKFDRPAQAKYLRRIHKWRPEARRRAKELMRRLVYSENPFMKLISKKDESWEGKYIPVPIVYK